KEGFADPDFGPREFAAETGISLRYLQKLFMARGSTCSEFIYSLRLDHAARLLHRRASLETSQALSEPISRGDFAIGSATRLAVAPKAVRAGTGERAPRAHDVRPRAV